MATFSTTNKAPGVYIQEITIPGPLQGVSTNIAAFVGPAKKGPLNTPTQLTNIGQFMNTFGDYIEDPYRVYAAHGVNGFFAEGGSVCYFVRVGTGAQASLNLLDRSGKNRITLVATAIKEGTAGNGIKIKVEDASVASTKAARASATVRAAGAPAGQRTVTTDKAIDAAHFNPGDTVLLSKAATPDVRAAISSISKDPAADTTTITVLANLANDYSGGTVRIADLIPGQTRIRADSVTGIEPGSYVSIAQAGGATENAVVRVVDNINNFVTLTNPLNNAYIMTGGGADVIIATLEFKLTVKAAPLADEVFDKLSADPRHSRYFKNLVASASVTVDFADPPTTTPPTANLPVAIGDTNLGTAAQGTAGADDAIASLQPSHYHAGVDTLKKISDVNLLCIPDAAGSHFTIPDTQDIQAYMVAHCEKMQDRFTILDCREMLPSAANFDAVKNQRQNLSSDGGYGALYFPWIGVSNPLASGKIFVPPSGHTAGVFANTDNNVGVFKAPANERVTSALAVEVTVADDEQGPLNELGINVIRSFPNQGIKIWGARTIAPTDVTAWRFVNVRRLLLFIEKTIQQGTRFAVFEPNNLTLWQQIKRMVNDFLTDQWKAGALFGRTPDLAFRVRVDETLNPPETRALGQLIVEVTVVPTTPAEFIIFRVVQDITGSTLRESTK